GAATPGRASATKLARLAGEEATDPDIVCPKQVQQLSDYRRLANLRRPLERDPCSLALRAVHHAADPNLEHRGPWACKQPLRGSMRVPSVVCSSVTTALLPTRVRYFQGSAGSVPAARRLVRCGPVGFRIRPLHPVR